MFFGFILESLKNSPRKLWVITIINSSNFSWFMFVSSVSYPIIFRHFTSQESWVFIGTTLFYFFATFSAIIGSILSKKMQRKKLLSIWLSIGIITPSILLFFQGEASILLFGPLLGISLGFGFPSSLSLYAENTEVKNRCRIGGITLLETFIMLTFAILINEILEGGLIGSIIILIILKSIAIFSLILYEFNKSNNVISREETTSWSSILSYKPFVLYFLPWLMFIITAVLTADLMWPELPSGLDPSGVDYGKILEIGDPLHYLATAIFSIISGIIGDRYGRRAPIILGLSILGVSFALMVYSITAVIVFIHLMTIGTAYGLIWPIYIAIPGDLATTNLKIPFSKERFYTITMVLPLTVYGGLGSIPRALGITIPPEILSPILCIILFISIIPILLAPEVLSKGMIKKMDYENHINKIKKIIEDEDKN